MIKYIIETVSSETDINGNRYHFARITSTRTGRSLVLDSVGGDSNAPARVCELLGVDWSEIHYTQHHERKRDWQRMRKFAVGDAPLYEHQLTARMLRALNRKQ